MKITKKKLTAFISVVAVLALLVGSLAFFSDRVDASATMKTSAADDIIKVTPDPEGSPEGIPEGGTEYDPDGVLDAEWNPENEDESIIPGDEDDLSFDLKNIGEDDIDVKETIVLTVKDASGNPLNLTTLKEFRLFESSTDDEYGALDGVVGTLNGATVESVSGNKITYTLPGFKLAKGEVVARNFTLVMNKYTGNAFQGATCTVEYLCEMRQNVTGTDPDADWDAIRTATTIFGGVSTNVVPAA